MEKAIICDIDGTLANIQHRRKYVEQSKKDWDTFYSEMGKDDINEWCREILKLFSDAGTKIILVTGRPDKYMHETIFWLDNFSVHYDELLMRKTKDNRKDSIVKKEIYDNQIKGKYEISFVLDDRNQVVSMWREEGLTCLQVAEGNF